MSAQKRREHLERAVAEGGSIMTARGAITREVPSSALLARTPEEKSAAREDLERRRRALDDEEGLLEGGGYEPDQRARGVSDDLPEEFPGRAALAESGINTYGEVSSFNEEDLTALKGIGAATAAKIVEAVKARKR
jgi:hypothetical protein